VKYPLFRRMLTKILLYLVLLHPVNTTNTTNNCFPLRLVQHVSTHMSHQKTQFEPLNISEFLPAVLLFRRLLLFVVFAVLTENNKTEYMN
jgi:hypothetical protein